MLLGCHCCRGCAHPRAGTVRRLVVARRILGASCTLGLGAASTKVRCSAEPQVGRGKRAVVAAHGSLVRRPCALSSQAAFARHRLQGVAGPLDVAFGRVSQVLTLSLMLVSLLPYDLHCSVRRPRHWLDDVQVFCCHWLLLTLFR